MVESSDRPLPKGGFGGILEISLTGNTEQESGVMEYWSIPLRQGYGGQVGVLVKIVIRFRPLTSDL